jgi:hypothetical protein
MAAGDTEQGETAFVSRRAVCHAAQAGLLENHSKRRNQMNSSLGMLM